MSPCETEAESASIFIVCSRRLNREGFQRLLEASTLLVSGAAQTFEEAAQDAASASPPRLLIAIFESNQEAEEALPHLRQLRDRLPSTKTMIVAASLRSDLLRAIVQIGVDGVLTNEISPTVLYRSIELVLLGQRLLPPEVAQLLHDAQDVKPGLQMDRPVPHPAARRFGTSTLSQREHEILQLLVDGCSNKIIARKLNITEATVKVHVKALLRKTQMTNRTQAAIWALNHGIQGPHWDREEEPMLSRTPRVLQPAMQGTSMIFPAAD